MSPPAATTPIHSGSAAGSVTPPVSRPARPEIELTMMNAPERPAASRVAVQPESTSSGVRKMPPPVPLRPASSPIPAPAATPGSNGTPGRSSSLVGTMAVARRQAPASRTAATSGRYSSPGSWMLPPMNAIGIEPAASGQRLRHGRWPARVKRMMTIVATKRLRTRAVGRIVSGAAPTSAIAAR